MIICPRCKEQNPDDATKCTGCGLKIKVRCPGCQVLNPIGKVTCSDCGSTIVKFCENCKTANLPKQDICRKCGESLPPAIINKKAPLLAAELINLTVIKNKINNPQTIDKILKKFYQIIAFEAKSAGQKAVKASETMMAIDFSDTEHTAQAILYSVEAAQNIIHNLHEFNYVLRNKLHLTLKVKIGLALCSKSDKKYFCATERSIATANEIIIGKEIAEIIKDAVTLQPAGTVEINGAKSQFYKLTEEIIDEQQIEKTEQAVDRQTETINQPKERNKTELQTFIGEQESVYTYLSDAFKNTINGGIYLITGEEGIGKSTIATLLSREFTGEEYFWMNALCDETKQIMPFYALTDMLKGLLGIPEYIVNYESTKDEITAQLSNIFGSADKYIADGLYSLLLHINPEEQQENLQKNQIFESIKMLLTAITSRKKLVILIEDVESIDRFSLEALKYVANGQNNKTTIHIIFNSNKDINLLKSFKESDLPKYVITLKRFSEDNAQNVIAGLLEGQDVIPTKLKSRIIKNSGGNALYLEQCLWQLFQMNAITNTETGFAFNHEISLERMTIHDNLLNLIKQRIYDVQQQSQALSEVLQTSAILGNKFMPVIVQRITEIDENEFTEIINYLLNIGIFVMVDNHHCIFKHKIFRDVIYNHIPDVIKIQKSKKIFEIMAGFGTRDWPQMASNSEKAEMIYEAMSCWNTYAKEANIINLKELYLYSQEKILTLTEKADFFDTVQKIELKSSIYEDIGKLFYLEKGPTAAEYLSNAIIIREKASNSVKVIDLLGYLSKNCMVNANYSGVIECTDKALSLIDTETMKVESALLNISKLEALYRLGNMEEAIITATSSILPILKDAVNSGLTINGLTIENIHNFIIRTKILLGYILAQQGRQDCIGIAEEIIQYANNSQNLELKIEGNAIKALYYSIQGNTIVVRDCLTEMQNISASTKFEDKTKLITGIINLTGSVITEKLAKAQDNADYLLSLAEKYGYADYSVIINLLSTKKLKEKANIEAVKEIYRDAIAAAAENKYATGALLGWYFISEVELKQNNTEKASSIAEKAIDIAEKANIHNGLFIMILNRLLSEISILKGNLEMAYIYAEKAYQYASANNLFYFIAEIFVLYGKIHQEYAVSQDESRYKNVKSAHDFYIKALDIAQRLEIEKLVVTIEKELTHLSTFCQLNAIEF